MPTRVGSANVRAQFEVERRGDGAAARARVRASTREYTRSVEIVVRTRQTRFKLPDFLYENDRTAHSVRIFDGTYSCHVKILAALLVRTTRIVLDEIRKLFIIGYIYWINVVRVHVVRVHGTFTTFVAY